MMGVVRCTQGVFKSANPIEGFRELLLEDLVVYLLLSAVQHAGHC